MQRRTFLALASAAATKTLAGTPRPLLFKQATQTQVVRFIAFGDSGTGDEQQAALARAMAVQQTATGFTTALMLGDNIYPDGNKQDAAAKFERPYAELLRRGVKFQAVLGNHDVRKGREWEINYPNFNMGGRAYRSFTLGENLIEFFALDSTEYDDAQARWLESALAGSQARWKIAYFHHPLYSSGSTHGSDPKLRAKLEPLFVKYNVAAVFSGHDHIYERIKPQQGVQYFVSGAGGKLRRGDLKDHSPLTVVGNDDESSFMLVEVTAAKIAFKALDATGSVLDSGEILPRAAARAAAAGK